MINPWKNQQIQYVQHKMYTVYSTLPLSLFFCIGMKTCCPGHLRQKTWRGAFQPRWSFPSWRWVRLHLWRTRSAFYPSHGPVSSCGEQPKSTHIFTVVSDELQLVGGKSPVNARSGQLNQGKENRTKIRIIFFSEQRLLKLWQELTHECRVDAEQAPNQFYFFSPSPKQPTPLTLRVPQI